MFINLDHLNDDEMNVLLSRYYDPTQQVNSILKEYNLNIKARDLYTFFPAEIHEEYLCEHCGSSLHSARLSKAMKTLNDKNNSLDWLKTRLYCPTCGHKPFNDCECFECVKKENMKQNCVHLL